MVFSWLVRSVCFRRPTIAPPGENKLWQCFAKNVLSASSSYAPWCLSFTVGASAPIRNTFLPERVSLIAGCVDWPLSFKDT